MLTQSLAKLLTMLLLYPVKTTLKIQLHSTLTLINIMFSLLDLFNVKLPYYLNLAKYKLLSAQILSLHNKPVYIHNKNSKIFGTVSYLPNTLTIPCNYSEKLLVMILWKKPLHYLLLQNHRIHIVLFALVSVTICLTLLPS